MADIQTILTYLTLISVPVGVAYHIITVRINQRNSKIALTNNIMQTMTSETAQKNWIELMNMQWDNYDDFEKKYGSDVNPDSYAKRMSVWQSYNLLGHLLEKNVVDAETCYIAGGTFSIYVWQKFKQILNEHEKRYVGSDAYTGLEYLAEEMLKLRKKNDSSYRVPDTFTKYLPEQ